jgi:glycosyltransferase involved in cell wall biosynthesis
VTDELTSRLASNGQCDLAVLEWGWKGSSSSAEEAHRPCPIYRPNVPAWDRSQMEQVVEEFGPDTVIGFGPPTTLSQMPALRNRPFFRWAGYVSYEASPLPRGARDTIGNMDVAVVPSAWCHRVVKAALPDRDCRLIPHGVNPDIFHPLPERDSLRSEVGLADRFVIGCVARNQFRKQIPILVKAFAKFSKSHSDAFLYLHMDPDDTGWRLGDLIDDYGIADCTVFTRGVSAVMGVGANVLNQIYNLFDVMVLPTMGEAFGLPILEAMAAGVPVAATDCSAVTELLESRGELIAPKCFITMPWDCAEYAIADESDLLCRLERLYDDADLRREYTRKGRELAEEMTWDRAASLWMEVLAGSSKKPRGADVEDPKPRVKAFTL